MRIVVSAVRNDSRRSACALAAELILPAWHRAGQGQRRCRKNAARDGARHDIGGERAEAGQAEVADRPAAGGRSRRRTRRRRRAACAPDRSPATGPDCAMTASRLACALVKIGVGRHDDQRGIFRGRCLWCAARARPTGKRPGNPRPPNSPFCFERRRPEPRTAPTTTLPTALTAASAPTMWPSAVCAEAEPMPPLQLTVVAPVPAPTLPSAKSAAAPAAAA